VAWLVGVARHKLADHWRRAAREQRGLAAMAVLAAEADDPWDEHLDVQVAHAALARLPGPQRAALTLRYLDGLPVGEVAGYLGRSIHATETLLVRARAAGLPQSSVSRIWRAFGLRPHVAQTWKLSADPEFIAKARDVVGRLRQPGRPGRADRRGCDRSR